MTPRDGDPTVRRLLLRPAYRRLWMAQTIRQAGDVAQFTTLALLPPVLTDSGFGVSEAAVPDRAPAVRLGCGRGTT